MWISFYTRKAAMNGDDEPSPCLPFMGTLTLVSD